MRRRNILGALASVPAVGLTGCTAGTTRRPRGAADDELLAAAFCYGFGLYEFGRTAQVRAGPQGGRFNQVGHVARLLDHTSRAITAPNNDTVYSSASLELSGGPVEVLVPSEPKRYFSVAFMDAFTDNFAYVGTRATRGQGGRFWVVGPQWTGAAPADVSVFRASTNDVWMLGRVLVDGPQDLEAAKALQQRISVRQVEASVRPRRFTVAATRVEDPDNFLGVVNEMLARSPGGQGQTARADRFAALGLGAGVGAASADVLAAWKDYLPRGLGALRGDSVSRELEVNGWGYPPRGVGNFGTDDRLRAAVALGGLAALGEEEAMYFQATKDSAGDALTGARSYRFRIPPGGIPADAFWSLTMYQAEPDGRFFLVENPIQRYSVGDRTPGMVKNADGSVDILIQRQAPAGPLAANWLPAAAGSIRLSLRAYLPRRELRERLWRVPPVEPVG